MADKIAELVKDPQVAKEIAHLRKVLELPDYEGIRQKVLQDPAVVATRDNFRAQRQAFPAEISQLLAGGLHERFVPEITKGSRVIDKEALVKSVTPEEANKEINAMEQEMAAVENRWDMLGTKLSLKDMSTATFIASGMGEGMSSKKAAVALQILTERDNLAYRIQDTKERAITPEDKAKLMALDRKNVVTEAEVDLAVTTRLEKLGVHTQKDPALVELITNAVKNNNSISNTPPAPEPKQSRDSGISRF